MPVTVGQIVDLCNKIAPQEDAEEWDNVGLLVGSSIALAHTVLCALDLTEAVIQEAVNVGADVIVTHHPVMFRGVKHLLEDEPEGRLLHRLVLAGISHIAMHTNYDNACPGVNDALASALGLRDVKAVDRALRVGITDCQTFGEFADHVEKALGGPVRRYGYPEQTVFSVGVLGGAGADYLPMAREAGCDVFVTGEISYHKALDAALDGVCVLEAGHAATERPGILALSAALQKAADAVQYKIRVIDSEARLFL